jgi:integrase
LRLSIDNALLSIIGKSMTVPKGKSLSNTKLSADTESRRTRQTERAALVATYTAAAQSDATTRSYDKSLRHFEQNGGCIPATPTMIAEYVSSMAGILAVATLQHRLIAIHRAHTDRALPSPVMDNLVKRTMQGIRRTFGVNQRQVVALSKDEIVEMMVHLDSHMPMRAARDKALILIGFAGAFRRSELVGLMHEDMVQYDSGVELLLRRSKTDQEGAGRTVFIPHARGSRCPVNALMSWLALAGISSGPLFRRISRYDKLVANAPLTPQSVALIVKASVRLMAGEDAARLVAGHSLRAGYCTEAATAGLQTHLIRAQTGHKSDTTLARYIRPVTQRKIPSLF